MCVHVDDRYWFVLFVTKKTNWDFEEWIQIETEKETTEKKETESNGQIRFLPKKWVGVG